MVIFDSHTHNINSHDGEQTPEEQLNSAIEKGFKGYAITDHCELEELYWEEYCKEHIPISIKKAKELKELYKDKIIISVGVEMGSSIFEPERANKIIAENSLDFILASCHCPKGMGDYCKYDYSKLKSRIPDILKNYFEILEQTSALCDFDSLSHLNYPIRYISGNYGIPVDLTPYISTIKKIMENLIKRDKALEINTSGFRQKIGVCLPNAEIINIYKNMGGKLITIGSDAHRSSDMGKDFDRTCKLLKECGFDRYYYYQKREPIEIII